MGKSGKGRRKKNTIGLKTAQILPKALTVREKDRSWSADYFIKLVCVKDFFNSILQRPPLKRIKNSCFDTSKLR